MKMIDFRTRYKAYQNAERKSAPLSRILSLVLMAFVFCPFYYGITSFVESFGLRVFLFLIAIILICIIGAVADSKFKRCFLKIFFKKELNKIS